MIRLEIILTFVVVLIICVCPDVKSQDNSSFLIQNNDFPTPINLLLENEDLILISSINTLNNFPNSTISTIKLSDGSVLAQQDFKGFVLSRNGFRKISNNYYLFGDIRDAFQINKSLGVYKLNPEFELLDSVFYTTPSMNSGATTCTSNDTYIVGISVDDIDPENRELNFTVIDTMLSIYNSFNFNTSNQNTFAWESINTPDNNFLISSSKNDFGNISRFNQINKLNIDGQESWQVANIDTLADNSVPTWMCELDNKEIIQSSKIDRRSDLEYLENNWNPEPLKITKYTPGGEVLISTLVNVSNLEEINLQKLIASNDNTFYAVGELRDNQIGQRFGLVIKFNSNLEIIWLKKYVHDLTNTSNYTYRIFNLIESNNKIIFLGTSRNQIGYQQIWVFTTNKNGCYSSVNCDELILTNLTSTIPNVFNLNIFPNPTNHFINIESDISEGKYFIYLINGALVGSDDFFNNKKIDLSQLVPGLYFITIKSKDNKSYSSIFAKH